MMYFRLTKDGRKLLENMNQMRSFPYDKVRMVVVIATMVVTAVASVARDRLELV